MTAALAAVVRRLRDRPAPGGPARRVRRRLRAAAAASSVIVFAALAGVPAWPGVTAEAADAVVLDVRDFGAKGDGVSDDSAAVQRAQRALPAAGGVIAFPAGVYAIGGSGIVLMKAAVTFRGAGEAQTILLRLQPGAPTVQSSNSFAGLRTIAFESMTFDGNLPPAAAVNYATMALYGTAVTDVRLSHCRFWKSPSGAITLNGMSNVVIEDSLFHSPGDATSTAITVTGGASHVTVRRNRFLYLKNGIVVDTGDTPPAPQATADSIEISDNYFDLGWWLLAASAAGEGSDVHYTAGGLSDANAQFPTTLRAQSVALAPSTTANVRVLPTRASGVALISDSVVDDRRAAFRTAGVRRGDVIRVGPAFAIIATVLSDTAVDVEEWLSDTDRTAVAPPPSSAAYTVYGVYLGLVTQATRTTLATGRWWDLDGRTVVPPPGTRYELLPVHPNYAIHAEAGTSHMTVANNTVRRGWSDQVSMFGSGAIVSGNTIEDGEDMGITLHGRDNIVEGNTVTHQGAGGIYVNATDSLIRGNTVRDSQWVNEVNTTYLGDIVLYDASRITVLDNVCERLSTLLGYYGIVVYGARTGSADNMLTGNVSRRHLRADIKLAAAAGSSVSGTSLVRNEGTLVSSGASGTTLNGAVVDQDVSSK